MFNNSKEINTFHEKDTLLSLCVYSSGTIRVLDRNRFAEEEATKTTAQCS
jgi:hypothetical protein